MKQKSGSLPKKTNLDPKPVQRRGIFGNSSSFEDRCFWNYKELEPVVKLCKGLGLKVVLTSGTFDIVHIGHARYLEQAKAQGDFLIVGVDSDAKVKARKGPERPIVPHVERLEMLAHMRPVDAVVLKDLKVPKWGLIKLVRPDVLIATKDTYTKEEIKELSRYCGQIQINKPMATTSTSAKIRRLQIGMAAKLEKTLVPRIMDSIKDSLDEIKGQ